jgi:alkylated DNA nucleotide flippase Atl1
MKAGETTLKGLLQGERQYLVPLYQRRYSWKRPQLQQLWEDLTGLIDAEPTTTHFIGSVVLAPSPTNTPAGVQSWLVVDGQQRLTTLSILLCAIRDHLCQTAPQAAARIDDLYLLNKYAAGLDRYTLLPTQADRAAWIALVEGTPDAGGQDLVGGAYGFFRGVLADDGTDQQLDLVQLEQAIVSRLSIVEIAAHADDNVHRIFESLNHTGQRLTQADLLRNYLFMRMPFRGDHVYEFQWLPLQRLLDDDRLEQLVWLELVLGGDDRATRESTYHAQQQRLKQLTSEVEIEEWITQLHRKARLYARILHPEHEPDLVLRGALDRLNRWGAAVVEPIALNIMLAHDQGDLTSAEAAQAMRVVESYLVRRMIAGLATNNTNRILMSVVKELDGKVPSAPEITRLLSGPRRRFPTDQLIGEAVLVNPFYWNGRGPQRTYILRCIEESYGHSEPTDFAKAKLTIEHVLPQSPTPEWLDMLAADATDDKSPEELHSELVHTLGNLSLTAYNSKLANDTFAAKKKILADSGLAMNRKIADQSTWSRKQIHERGRELTEKIIAMWPGPDRTVAEQTLSPQWSLMTQVLASIPAGRWTSYSDIAEVIGSHQVAVGARLANVTMPNAHRVLKLHGTISPEFRWPDPQRTDDPRAILEMEGITFNQFGRAAQAQRMAAKDLAEAIGLEVPAPDPDAS